jgi:hypothetical protein
MLFELKADFHDLGAYVRDFLAQAGDERWKKRAVQLGQETMMSPFLGF